MIRFYLDINSLIYTAVLLFSFQTSNALAVLAQDTGISHTRASRTFGNLSPAWKLQGSVPDLSLSSQFKDVLPTNGISITTKHRSSELSDNPRKRLDPVSASNHPLRRRGFSEEESSNLHTRTDKRPESRAQSNTKASQDNARIEDEEDRSYQRKRVPAFLQRQLVAPIPIKRTRLVRSKDGEWERSDDKRSSPKDTTQSNVAIGRKGDERARSPSGSPQSFRGQSKNANAESPKMSHSISGARFLNPVGDKLRQTPIKNPVSTIGQQSDAYVTITAPPKIQPSVMKSKLPSIKDHPDIPRTNDAILMDQRHNQAIAKPISAPSGPRSLSPSSQQRDLSGSQEIGGSGGLAHSFESHEAVSALRHSGNSPPETAGFLPFADHMNRLAIKTRPQVEFRVPPARFPSSVPESDKLNKLIDAGSVARTQRAIRRYNRS